MIKERFKLTLIEKAIAIMEFKLMTVREYEGAIKN
jgi:hypothetical protein